MKRKIIAAFLLINSSLVFSQIITREDSLNAGLVAPKSATVISGYGSFKYANNVTLKDAKMNVDRVILFFGHRFSKDVSFFSEMEIEDAKIAGGELGGEFALEQAFLKFNVNRNNYFTAGLFIPRIGIINENHLPTTFNGNERPFVERLIIPSTWRELGVGFYGNSNKIPGLNYSCALVNGLSSKGFSSEEGIRGARFEGSNANASALAATGALLYYYKNFRAQVSTYYGGTSGASKSQLDSLNLNNGRFRMPVSLYEANIQYLGQKLSVKLLSALVRIKNAGTFNSLFNTDSPENMFGSYAELGYNVFKKDHRFLRVFSRYEYLNLHQKVPANVLKNDIYRQHYLVSGFTFCPAQGVNIKLDYTFRLTGNQNPQIISDSPYFAKQSIFTLGLGYSF